MNLVPINAPNAKISENNRSCGKDEGCSGCKFLGPPVWNWQQLNYTNAIGNHVSYRQTTLLTSSDSDLANRTHKATWLVRTWFDKAPMQDSVYPTWLLWGAEICQSVTLRHNLRARVKANPSEKQGCSSKKQKWVDGQKNSKKEEEKENAIVGGAWMGWTASTHSVYEVDASTQYFCPKIPCNICI